MPRRLLAASTLATAVALALTAPAAPLEAADDGDKMEKCYGVNARGQNDCAAGAHSCAGQSTKDRDAEAFVLLPKGVCAKIAGGIAKAG